MTGLLAFSLHYMRIQEAVTRYGIKSRKKLNAENDQSMFSRCESMDACRELSPY